MVLSAKNIKFSYSSKNSITEVIDNLSFTFHQKKIYLVIGPSGCGKTTLLHLIAGLLKPTQGIISFSDAVSNHMQNVGYVFQQPSLIPWKTVLDNVLLGSVIKNNLTNEMIDKAHTLLRYYGLEDYLKKFPSVLSGGMQQRVSIIRAIVSGAKILLLDEPFSNLDISLKRELQKDLSDLVDKENLIAIMVSHDFFEATRLGDEIILLSMKPAIIVDQFVIPFSRTERMNADFLFQQNLLPYINRIINYFNQIGMSKN
jgi:NitT/TauT family transport system ATP-binding protein